MSTSDLDRIRQSIRRARISRGWSLGDFEIQSGGEIKAVTMGSYERGERTLSIPKLMQISSVLGISVVHLLSPAQVLYRGQSISRHIYDLHALHALMTSSEKDHLVSYIQEIIRERGDWQGAVISLRRSDVENLERIFAASAEIRGDYNTWLESQKISLVKNSHN